MFVVGTSQKNAPRRIWVGLALLLVSSLGIGLALPKTAYAEPHCAVVYHGLVSCPPNVGAGSDDCFVNDPAVSTAYQKVACNSDQYKLASSAPAAIPGCNGADKTGCDPALTCKQDCDLVARYVNPLINVLAALVGVAVVISIIYAGIQYASSADDPQKVTQAKQRIGTSVATLVGFFVLYMFLQWLVPGGFLQR